MNATQSTYGKAVVTGCRKEFFWLEIERVWEPLSPALSPQAGRERRSAGADLFLTHSRIALLQSAGEEICPAPIARGTRVKGSKRPDKATRERAVGRGMRGKGMGTRAGGCCLVLRPSRPVGTARPRHAVQLLRCSVCRAVRRRSLLGRSPRRGDPTFPRPATLVRLHSEALRVFRVCVNLLGEASP